MRTLVKGDARRTRDDTYEPRFDRTVALKDAWAKEAKKA